MWVICDNEDVVKVMGKDVEYCWLEVFIFGVVLMGLGGVLFVYFNWLIMLEVIDLMVVMFFVWIMLILGGLGNNCGVIFGVVVVWIIWFMFEILIDWLLMEYVI